MGVINLSDRIFTNKEFGKALELYYKKGYSGKQPVGKFLNFVFKLNDARLERIDTYQDACIYFKNKYVVND